MCARHNQQKQTKHAPHARTRDVGGAEEKLRAVVVGERRVPPALLLAQAVHLALERRVRRDAARLAHDLPAQHVLALDAAQQQADVVARLALVEQLFEHLDARHRAARRRLQADDLHLLARLDDAFC